MNENFWRNLVEMSIKTEEDEISCIECLEILDEYVDLLDSGLDPAQVLPQLEKHLTVCHCCHAELEGVLTAIKSAAEPEANDFSPPAG